MATYLRLGPTTDLYDLLDEATASHIYGMQGSIRTTQKKDDYWIEVYECTATGTHAAIVNYEEDIVDHLENAQLYANDLHQDTVIWLYEYADNETAKRAAVLGGSLVPYSKSGTSRLMDLADTVYYMLTINRGPWEQTSATTIVNGVTFDGDDPIQEMTSLKGDKNGRISKIQFRGSATNDETTPLTRVWAGIREKYGGTSLFSPVINLEYAGTIENETTVEAIADGNTYNSTGLRVTFGDGVYERRAVISLKNDFWAGQLLTNGDAEDGDLTGWTDDISGFVADTDHERSGTYGFYSDNTAAIYQDVSVTAGMAYAVEFYYQIYTATSGWMVMEIFYLDSGLDQVGDKIYRIFDTVNGGFDQVESLSTAPTGAEYLRLRFFAYEDTAIEVAIDDARVYPLKTDHYQGQYTVLARAKLSAGSSDVDIAATFGYTSSDQMTPLGSPQSVTETDWKLIPLGTATFPPGRNIADVDSVWRTANLGFEIYAQRITGSPNLDLDALILIPGKHSMFIDSCSICRSSFTIDDGTSEYDYADLIIYITELDEIVSFAEAEDFSGIDTGITESIIEWEIPNSDGVLVAFAERDASHEIADDFVITMEYYPRYDTRNTD